MRKIVRAALSRGKLRPKASMPTEASVLDPELEEEILEILKICGTHMASISVRSLRRGTNGIQTEHQLRTMLRTGAGHQDYTIFSNREEVFHVASITKVLIAVAIVIAIEIKAGEDVPDNSYAKFKDIQDEPLTKLYNQYSPAKIGALPGNPTIYNYLIHSQGSPSTNNRLLAPDGTPIMTLGDIPGDLVRPIALETTHRDKNESWTEYSNTNYSIIAMVVEALWGRSLDTFMDETLFRPLKMKSTSIGFPPSRDTEINGWVVHPDGKSEEIARPRYQVTGAEAGSLGAYSTARDLDIFYNFVLESFHGGEVLPGFDLDILGKLLKMENEDICYTPFGLYTTLDSSLIGSMSSNRLQFRDKPFSTYPVLPGSSGREVATYYMAGSAIGCSCATGFSASVGKENFAVVVLTDTSGPVDSADHLLRLILRRIVRLRYAQSKSGLLQQPKSIRDMVKQAMAQSLERWKQARQVDADLIQKAPQVERDVTGVFKGDGFSQQLFISKGDDGKIYMAVGGSSTSGKSKSFELIWMDESSVKLCVPSHLSIDCLGDGDWSNLIFIIQGQEQNVQRLIRKTAWKEDHFVRVATQSV